MKNKICKSILCFVLTVAVLTSIAVPFSAAKIKAILGDVNDSGLATVMDVTLIQRYLADMPGDYLAQIETAGDVDRNRTLESSDATYILRYCSGVRTPFQVNQPVTITGTDPFGTENNIKLKVWAPESSLELTTQLCNEFIARYPEKVISITVQAQEEGDLAYSYINNPASAADVFSMASDQISFLMERNALSPLTDEEAAKVKKRDTGFSVDSVTSNGKLMAFPETGENGYYLVYDKRVVSDNDAKTLEGILAACRRADKQFVIDAGNAYYSCMFAFTGGLKLNGINSEYVQQFNNYNEEKVVDSLEAFSTLFHQYNDIFMSNNVDRIGSGMAIGVVGAGIDGTWNAATIKNVLGSNYGAAKLPTIRIKGVNTQIYSMCGSKSIGVKRNTLYPKAAHALADYLTNERSQYYRLQNLNWSPSNIELIHSDIMQEYPSILACLEQSEYAVPQIDIANTFWSPMGSLGNYLVTGTVSRTNIRNKFRQTINDIKDE